MSTVAAMSNPSGISAMPQSGRTPLRPCCTARHTLSRSLPTEAIMPMPVMTIGSRSSNWRANFPNTLSTLKASVILGGAKVCGIDSILSLLNADPEDGSGGHSCCDRPENHPNNLNNTAFCRDSGEMRRLSQGVAGAMVVQPPSLASSLGSKFKLSKRLIAPPKWIATSA